MQGDVADNGLFERCGVSWPDPSTDVTRCDRLRHGKQYIHAGKDPVGFPDTSSTFPEIYNQQEQQTIEDPKAEFAMVSLKNMQAANEALPRRSITAVFVGATSGIGLGAIESTLKHTKASKLYIIGRSRSKFQETLTRLEEIDTFASLTFVEAQVSSLKEVDRVVSIVEQQESYLDILWLSQGGLDASAYTLNDEGILPSFAITYYSRMLFMHRLAPLLRNSPDQGIISVLSAGEEGKINTSDLGIQDPKNYGFISATKQCVTMMSLAMHEMSLKEPNISFMHTFPGAVKTNVHDKWARTFTGAWTPVGWAVDWVMTPALHLFSMTAEVAGEIGFYEMTSKRFAASKDQNSFRVWDNAEETCGCEELLMHYRYDGTAKKLWKHTMEAFDKALQG